MLYLISPKVSHDRRETNYKRMKTEHHKNLRELNSFGFPVYAAQYAEFGSPEELKTLFAELRPTRWYLLGGGSNTLFAGDFDGLVLHPSGGGIRIVSETPEEVLTEADAGVEWDAFVALTVERGWSGAENLSLIPGSVGAAPVQNIGAYGAEAKDIIRYVDVWYPETDREERLENAACRFGYRDSIFKQELKGRAIVLRVGFALAKHFVPRTSYGNIAAELEKYDAVTPATVRQAVIAIRRAKLPDPKVIGNGGSFFKNPVVARAVAEALAGKYPEMPRYPDKNGIKIPAGWLIEQCGWKGYREGDAGVHCHQALVLVNYGTAAPHEVIGLSNRIVESVREKFGIDIHPEINIIG